MYIRALVSYILRELEFFIFSGSWSIPAEEQVDMYQLLSCKGHKN